MNHVLDAISDQVEGDRARALVVLSSMLGAIRLARIVADPVLVDALVNESRKSLSK